MNLQTGTYHWPTTLVDPPTYEELENDITCDVLIVGGGSSGAQCAYYLSETDLDVVVIEKCSIGSGSTSANTAIIQYSGEKLFTDLIHTFGEDYIGRHVELCRKAIDEIETASKKITIDCEFSRRDTLYFASYPEDVQRLKREYEYLKERQCELTFLSANNIENKYGFKKDAAIYSYNDGEMNPFKFTHGLLEYAAKKGVRIFEQTEMNGHVYNTKNDYTVVRTKNGYSINTRKIIFCAGYEGINIKKEKKASFVSTYTVTTKPIDDSYFWHKRTLIWETARPYTYIRSTKDNRIIIGGLDENTFYPEVRDGKLPHKKNQLISEFQKLFPNIPVEIDTSLTAFYGGTIDGLPIIGVYDEFPSCYFLFGFGDNGTVYSQMLAKIIVEEIVEGSSKDLELYLHNRPLVV